MIYPKKKQPEMIQVAGDGSKIRANMEGAERIYSRPDTKKIIEMARAAKSRKDLIALGRFVASATKRQDSAKSEFVQQ